jgi:prenyltransferase beta subunit
MTFRREMLQVARLGPKMLGDSADLVAAFVHGQWNADGGVRDRAGASDLYYAVFGLECLQALQRPTPGSMVDWLRRFADGATLDFVHRCCLARAWAIVDREAAPAGLVEGVLAHRSRDGGFAQRMGEEIGNAYAAYLGLGALQDLGAALPPAVEVLASIEACRSRDGGYANHPGGAMGSTPTTVAAVFVRHVYDARPEPALGDWLDAQRHGHGGFRANPQAPIPDLLSTATALHALACLGRAPAAEQVERDLDYLDTLWTNTGAFHGHWAEDVLDVEYTYYGLLALGHLSLPT